MEDYESILSAASELPVANRLRLIDELVASVPDDQSPSLAEAWLEEIQRRSAEIESGAVQTESWDAVRSRLFKKHGVDGAD
jgi:putative addiction module component (TIGR02574 family)